MKNRDGQIAGEWGLSRWLLLGVFGLVLAVGIALVAGSLASQPVGLSGEPIPAGSVLEPAQDSSPPPDAKPISGGHEDKAGTGTASPPVTSPPVATPTEAKPPAATGTPDDYSGTGVVVSKSESGEPRGGEVGGGADDD